MLVCWFLQDDCKFVNLIVRASLRFFLFLGEGGGGIGHKEGTFGGNKRGNFPG